MDHSNPQRLRQFWCLKNCWVFENLQQVGSSWRLRHFFSPQSTYFHRCSLPTPIETIMTTMPHVQMCANYCQRKPWSVNLESKVQSEQVNITFPTLQKSFHFCHVLLFFWTSSRFSRQTHVVCTPGLGHPSQFLSSAKAHVILTLKVLIFPLLTETQKTGQCKGRAWVTLGWMLELDTFFMFCSEIVFRTELENLPTTLIK